MQNKNNKIYHPRKSPELISLYTSPYLMTLGADKLPAKSPTNAHRIKIKYKQSIGSLQSRTHGHKFELNRTRNASTLDYVSINAQEGERAKYKTGRNMYKNRSMNDQERMAIKDKFYSTTRKYKNKSGFKKVNKFGLQVQLAHLYGYGTSNPIQTSSQCEITDKKAQYQTDKQKQKLTQIQGQKHKYKLQKYKQVLTNQRKSNDKQREDENQTGSIRKGNKQSKLRVNAKELIFNMNRTNPILYFNTKQVPQIEHTGQQQQKYQHRRKQKEQEQQGVQNNQNQIRQTNDGNSKEVEGQQKEQSLRQDQGMQDWLFEQIVRNQVYSIYNLDQ